ncbi:hypothetical protein FQZ97_970430 [compost metagenome]
MRFWARYVAKLQMTRTFGVPLDEALNDMPATEGFWIEPVLTASLSPSLSSPELAPAVPRRSSSSPAIAVFRGQRIPVR